MQIGLTFAIHQTTTTSVSTLGNAVSVTECKHAPQRSFNKLFGQTIKRSNLFGESVMSKNSQGIYLSR